MNEPRSAQRSRRRIRGGSWYVLFAFGVIAAFIVYQVFFNETRKVLRRLREVEIALTAPPQEPDIARFARIGRLRHYLAPEILVVAEPAVRQVASRDVLLSMLSAWKPPADGLEVHFVEVQIRIGEAKTTAEARVTVEFDRHDGNPADSTARSDQSTLETSHATVALEKREGEWLVTSAESRDSRIRP